MGGRNAMCFAAQYGHRLNALVVEDIGVEPQPESAERTRRLLDLVPTPFASRQAAKAFLLGEFVQKIKDRPQPEVLAQYFFTNIEINDQGLADWRFSKAAILETVNEGRKDNRSYELQSISCPILLIRGADSDELSKEEYARMLKLNSRIKGVEIPQAGHWVHFDQKEHFCRALAAFLASL